MTPRDFCYWLQGFMELKQHEANGTHYLNREQIEEIKNHLDLVFKKDTPDLTPAETQGYFQTIDEEGKIIYCYRDADGNVSKLGNDDNTRFGGDGPTVTC